MSIYSEKELERLHELTLNMAKHFVDFCNNNGLLCYFCGGGCIGAIRNKGFIPWDDDLDFFMPRNDYEKLKKLWNNNDHKRYKISYTTENYKDKNIFVTIRDAETTYVKDYQKDLDIVHGLVLDVFPLDGCPKGKIKRKIQMIESVVAILMCTEIIPESHGKILKYGSKLALSIIPKKKRFNVYSRLEKAISKYKIEDTEYVTELYAGPKYMRNEYKKELFMNSIFVDFDDTKMPIPIGYDGYLRQAFGDYMKLPPESARVAHHDFSYMDLEVSCINNEKIVKKKAIGFLKDDISYPTGGGRVAVNLANEFVNDYAVSMISICSSKNESYFKIDERIQTYVLYNKYVRIRKVLIPSIIRIRRYIKKNDIKVIFGVGASLSLYLIGATLFSKTKFVLCEHSNIKNKYNNDFIQRISQRFGSKFANKVITLTCKDRDSYIEKFSLNKNKVLNIYNWIDDSFFEKNIKYAMNSNKIISVGRVDKVKGYEELIQVAAIVLHKFSSWSWDIYGDGDEEYKNELIKLIDQNKLNGKVNIKNSVKNIYDIYTNYSFIVLTSHYEGLPMVLLEAMSQKIPAVSFNIDTGPSEIINNSNGILINDRNVELMAKEICALISNENRRMNMSANCQLSLNKFRKENILLKWKEVLEELTRE